MIHDLMNYPSIIIINLLLLSDKERCIAWQFGYYYFNMIAAIRFVLLT